MRRFQLADAGLGGQLADLVKILCDGGQPTFAGQGQPQTVEADDADLLRHAQPEIAARPVHAAGEIVARAEQADPLVRVVAHELAQRLLDRKGSFLLRTEQAVAIGEAAAAFADLLTKADVALAHRFVERDIDIGQKADDRIAAFAQVLHGQFAAGHVIRPYTRQGRADDRLIDQHHRMVGGEQAVDVRAFHQVLGDVGDDADADRSACFADDAQKILAVIFTVMQHRVIAALAEPPLDALEDIRFVQTCGIAILRERQHDRDDLGPRIACAACSERPLALDPVDQSGIAQKFHRLDDGRPADTVFLGKFHLGGQTVMLVIPSGLHPFGQIVDDLLIFRRCFFGHGRSPVLRSPVGADFLWLSLYTFDNELSTTYKWIFKNKLTYQMHYQISIDKWDSAQKNITKLVILKQLRWFLLEICAYVLKSQPSCAILTLSKRSGDCACDPDAARRPYRFGTERTPLRQSVFSFQKEERSIT